MPRTSWDERMAPPVRRIDQYCCLSLCMGNIGIYSLFVHALIVFQHPSAAWILIPDKPQSLPELVCPCQEPKTFYQRISNKIHKNLVTKTISSKDKSLIPACHTSVSKQLSTRSSLDNDIVVAAMNTKADTVPTGNTLATPQGANDDLIIVTGTRKKQRIQEAYEEKFGSGYPNSIVTRKKGKLKSFMSVLHSRRMRPCKDNYYRVNVLELHSVIATILKLGWHFRQVSRGFWQNSVPAPF